MLTRHIDIFALLLIVLGLLTFGKAPELRLTPDVADAGFRVRTAIARIHTIQRTSPGRMNVICPLSALKRYFR